jgi:hypothetical protein
MQRDYNNQVRQVVVTPIPACEDLDAKVVRSRPSSKLLSFS